MENGQEPNTIKYRRARFETLLRADYHYSPLHLWIGRQQDDSWRVGLTKFGARLLGETVDFGFDVRIGDRINFGLVLGWIEGFKALSELVSLADGEFLGANPALEAAITLVNQDPAGAGWLYAVSGVADSKCLTAEEYARVLDRTIDGMLNQAGAQ